MAYVRAQESRRPDRLFNDPYAQLFVDAAPGAFPATRDEAERVSPAMVPLGAAFGWHAILRTRFFDDYLTSACDNGCGQVVLLAAGLDTRAFRLDWPATTRLFEIDLPEVMAFKEPVLSRRYAQPRCRRTVVAADLRAAWPQHLTAAGFEPDAATAWLAEGLLSYLSPGEATRLLADVTTLSAVDSQLAFEHGGIAHGTVFDQAQAAAQMREYTAMWKGGPGPEAPDWLAGHGWRVRLHDAVDLSGYYRRPVPAGAGGGYLTATRGSSGSDSGSPNLG
jgi:methyltransferase (TIGR00027 family)